MISKRQLGLATISMLVVLAACGGGGGGSSGGSGGSGSSNSSSAVPVSDWGTYQGNAAHTGFVDVTLSPASFQQAWTWSLPTPGKVTDAVHSVVTGGGRVYVSNDDWLGRQRVFALDATTGTTLWSKDLGEISSQGAPAYAAGRLYTESFDWKTAEFLFMDIEASTGMVSRTYRMSGQNFPNSQPVAAHGVVVVNAGDNNVWPITFSTSTSPFSFIWAAVPSNNAISGIQTPAVDSRYVYNYTGNSLDVFNLADGSRAFTISDPTMAGTFDTGQYNAAPIIGSLNNILAYSGPNDSATATASVEGRKAGRVFSSYDIPGRKVNWQTTTLYRTTPAVNNGVIYIARNTPDARLDALKESDGSVLWSWTPPAGEVFQRNTIVTRNLVFVSTDKNVHAIDLNTRTAVWSSNAPGYMSMGLDASGKARLHIVKSLYSSYSAAMAMTGDITSFKLQ
jgi:outer membrane protein assembly factor BamB